MRKQHEPNGTTPQPFARDQGTSVIRRARQAAAVDDTVQLGATRIAESDEVLVVDGRANLGPAEQVEHKLNNLLGSGLLPVSHVRMTALFGGRRSR